MATLLAPFNNAMKLGSGFNSFTQELCVDHAVVAADDAKPEQLRELKRAGVAQSVVYKTSIVKKVTDVTDALNLNAAFTIKYDKLNADGNGRYVDTNTIKTSDINFTITVKVVNQVIMDDSLTKFSPISGLKPSSFTQVYGDSFISGFQEGGEFTAVISIKVKDRDQLETIKADAAVALTSEKFQAEGKGDIDKTKKELFDENETAISVSWTGGGQDLKKPDEDWTYETMRNAALKFPDLVAQTPVRTNAILTRYSSLKSFQTLGAQFAPMSYEHAGNYATALQEAYLDYKNIAKDIQVLAFDVVNGAYSLKSRDNVGKDFADESMKASKPALLASMAVQSQSDGSTSSDEGSFTSVKANDVPPNEPDNKVAPAKTVQPLIIEGPYPPSIFGLEAARVHCRFMMNRIVSEVDAVTRDPGIAVDETRALPYMSPFLFKLLLPVGVSSTIPTNI